MECQWCDCGRCMRTEATERASPVQWHVDAVPATGIAARLPALMYELEDCLSNTVSSRKQAKPQNKQWRNKRAVFSRSLHTRIWTLWLLQELKTRETSSPTFHLRVGKLRFIFLRIKTKISKTNRFVHVQALEEVSPLHFPGAFVFQLWSSVLTNDRIGKQHPTLHPTDQDTRKLYPSDQTHCGPTGDRQPEPPLIYIFCIILQKALTSLRACTKNWLEECLS